MRPSFVRLPQPFIVGLLREKDPDSIIATIKNSEYDGAQAFLLQISKMDSQYVNFNDLRKVFASTTRPVLTLNYRENGYIPDEERVKVLLMSIEAGAAAIDMPADTFDPNPADWNGNTHVNLADPTPRELSMVPEVIEKQKKLIEQVHTMGAEVLISSHTRKVMNTEQVIAHAKEMESRGADAVKIVNVGRNEDEVLETLKSVVALKRNLKVPFLLQCHGANSKLTRVLGPMFGSMLVLCNQRFTNYTFNEQPPIHAMRSVFQNVDWKVNKPATEERFDQA
jgi:hypothetical protein